MTEDPLADARKALADAEGAFASFAIDGVVAHLSAAIRGFTAGADVRAAAMASVRLGQVYEDVLGNLTAARALYSRAERLLENEPACLEQGWVAVAAMGCDVDDPEALLAAAERALACARRFGDVNLETKALADAGLAHVQAGRVAVGMTLLDEAMGLACGPANDGETAARSVCSFFTACHFAGDFARANNWAEPLRRQGLIGAHGPAPAFLSSHCDSVHATLLLELGRWGEAEAVLDKARAAFEAALPGAAWHPELALADLRVRQRRWDEAETLLLGKDYTLHGLVLAARMHLGRGDLTLARATVERGLRSAGDDRLRGVELFGLLVDLELCAGDLAAAARAGEALGARAAGLEMPAMVARAAAAKARILAAGGDVLGALSHLEPALDRLDAKELPWLRALLLIELGRLRQRAAQTDQARSDARAARALLKTLDVELSPEDTSWLDASEQALSPRVSAPARAAAARLIGPSDDKWWTVEHGGTTARFQGSKGLSYLGELIAAPHVERHVLDLVDRVEGVDPDGRLRRRALGDVGPVVDAQARTAYRRRIEQLRAEVEAALASGRLAAAEKAQQEIEQLVAELARAFGLGERRRIGGSPAEKARLNVTRALRAAIAKLSEALPGPGKLLDARVRTGLYCAYRPVDSDEVRWVFSQE